jgi:chromosome segregation ATPase
MAVPSREQFWQTWSRQVLAPLIEQDLAQRGFRADPVKLADYAAPYYLTGTIPDGGNIDPSRAQWANLNRFNQDYQALFAQEAAAQQAQIEAEQRRAEEAARALAAEQARIQAELQAEQQTIIQRQQEEASAIEAQLARERETVQAEQETLKAQFETERQQTEQLISEAQAETQRQQLAAKRESAVALNVGKQTALARLREQQADIAPVRVGQASRQRSTIGQPGVASTRVSTRPSIGGYGGTSAGRVNPTGLNI